MALARRLSLSSGLAFFVALVLAIGVAAGSTSTVTLSNSCSNTGGRYGTGQIELKVRATEMAKSGVTHIRFVAWLEHQSRADGGAWLNHLKQARTTSTWANNTADHSRVFSAVWDIGGDGSVYFHRISLTVKFLNAGGNAVATHHVISTAC